MRNWCVLILEEDASIARLEASVSGACGCAVDIADTAVEALTLLEARPYDAILVGLPLRVGGEEFLRQLLEGRFRQFARRTIALTTRVEDSEMCAQLADGGFYAVVGEPFDVRMLAQVITACIRNRDAVRPTLWVGLPRSLFELCPVNSGSADDGGEDDTQGVEVGAGCDRVVDP